MVHRVSKSSKMQVHSTSVKESPPPIPMFNLVKCCICSNNTSCQLVLGSNLKVLPTVLRFYVRIVRVIIVF